MPSLFADRIQLFGTGSFFLSIFPRNVVNQGLAEQGELTLSVGHIPSSSWEETPLALAVPILLQSPRAAWAQELTFRGALRTFSQPKAAASERPQLLSACRWAPKHPWEGRCVPVSWHPAPASANPACLRQLSSHKQFQLWLLSLISQFLRR